MATEQQVENSLKALNELKAALDEHAMVAITDPQREITCVNDKFCSLSRFSSAGLLGRDRHVIDSGCHSRGGIRDLWTTIADGKVWCGGIKNRRHIDMTQMVREVITEWNQSGNRSLETRVGDLRACEGDPALVKQMWINLISNAVKRSRSCSSPLVEAGCDQAAGTCIYFVRDHGVGFDMKYAHKLFGVFQRLHRADEFAGPGVGRMKVHRAVRPRGGQVRFNAGPDRGATCYFKLEETENYDRQRN